MGRIVATPAPEASIWNLLTRDVRLGPDDLDSVGLRPYLRPGEDGAAPLKYQIFEVITAAIFARLKPEYTWAVSPNRADGGVDFVGRGPFLRSEYLGIDASIIIGGECKKRSPAHALDALQSSILKMCETLRPTFIVGVVSAPLSSARVAACRNLLEAQLNRHCHILDRRQIEGLIAQQLDVLAMIAQRCLDTKSTRDVLAYFNGKEGSRIALEADSALVAAAMGWPFSIPIRIRHASPGRKVRLWWRCEAGEGGLRCIAPSGMDTPVGARFQLGEDVTRPFSDEIFLEFVTHRAGNHELGALEVMTDDGRTTTCPLPSVNAAPDFRPAFYAPPYQGALDEIAAAFARARAGRPTLVGITGAGGGGKTRMCEEAAIEARRLGASYISAEQPNSSDRPYHLFADLLVALSPRDAREGALSRGPLAALERLQPDLADRARTSITSLIDKAGAIGDDGQDLLSAFVLLISARSRNAPLVIHLQNMHWCSTDALEFIERLAWQLRQIAHGGDGVNAARTPARVLFLLEGRTHEHRAPVDSGWSTRAFEAFLDRMDCSSVACRSFTPRESVEFAERLFETSGSASRRTPDGLLRVQRKVSDAIVRASGGNPFHILEQIKLLRQWGVLAVNPQTGLLFLVFPPAKALDLPAAVAETIHARWRYWAERDPDLGSLVLAAAMFEDRLPPALFGHLWRTLAPGASKTDLDGLELFRLPEANAASEFAFRHENYFHALHGLQASAAERERILEAYLEWFRDHKVRDPELLFIYARVVLQSDPDDLDRSDALLREVVRLSEEQRKPSLVARSMAVLLDGVIWPAIRRGNSDIASFVAACNDEVVLARLLIMTGNRDLALNRVGRALDRLSREVSRDDSESFDALEQRRITLCSMQVRALFNNGEPVRAAALAEDMLADAVRLIPDSNDPDPTRRRLLMEVFHTHAVAAALAGDVDRALETSEHATQIARTLQDHDARALEVISTHGNILVTRDPLEAINVLEHCRRRAHIADPAGRLRMRLEINRAMAEIVLAYDLRDADRECAMAKLHETEAALRRTGREANAAGRHADAAAAALLSGIAMTLLGRDACGQFAEAVAAASRAGQLETLWRAQINLAHSLSLAGGSPLESAASALAILSSTLQSGPPNAISSRFRLVAMPMAQAARYCLVAGDPRGAAALSRFPTLAALFVDPGRGEMHDSPPGFRNREWLRIGDVDYVLY